MQLDGSRLRQARVAAGYSLRQFAELIGLSHVYLSYAERNSPSRPVTPGLVAKYERALGTPIDVIVSEDDGEMRRRHVLQGLAASAVVLPGLRSNAATMVSGLESALYNPVISSEPVSLARLQEMIQSGRGDFSAVRLSELAFKVPSLIKTAVATRNNASYEHRLAYEAALSDVYVLGNELAIKLHEHELAAVLADRAVVAGRASDDPLTVARAMWRASVSLRRSKHPETAGNVISDAAQEFYSATGLRAPAHAGQYARMLCCSAYTAAMGQHRDLAYSLLAQATEVVTEHGQRHFTFDDVRLYGISVARVNGDFGQALKYSGEVTAGALNSDERRVRYLEDTAISLWGAGKPAETFRALLNAERISTEEVKYRPWAHRLTVNLIGVRQQAGLTGLHEFAKRIGVGASPPALV